MQCLIFGSHLRKIPFQAPYSSITFLYRFAKTIDDPQVLMVHIIRMPILTQNPFCGQTVQIGAGMLIEADIIVRRPGMRHAYLLSKLSISQFTLESFWISVQNFLYLRLISVAIGAMSFLT